MSGPYAGYDSIDAAIEGLRRARFKVLGTFVLPGRGLVVEGEILDGVVKKGMTMIPTLKQHPNVLVPKAIKALEFVLHGRDVENVALVIDPPMPGQELNLAAGTIVDVLEHSPEPN